MTRLVRLAILARRTGTGLLLIVTNLVPLVGVAFLGWDLATILVLYWLESGIVGLLNVPKILLASGDEPSGTPEGPLGRVVLAAFFCVHYGIFWVVHGAFVFAIAAGAFILDDAGAAAGSSPSPVVAGVEAELDWGAIVVSTALLAIVHIVSFFVNYLGRGEYRRTTTGEQMMRPYGRVVILHLTILGGGFLIAAFGSPAWMLVVMVVLKTLLDLSLHLRERVRSGSIVVRVGA